VLAAKLVVAALVGVVVMVTSMGLGVAACYLTLQQFPEAVAPVAGTFGHLAVIAVVSGAVLAVIGVALGTLIRNQTVAITVSIAWLYIVDTLVVLLWPSGGKYLPSGLIAGMMALNLQASENGTSVGIDTTNMLTPTAATLALLGYGVVFAGLAVATSLRRDVD
jgi:ABC-type transport system involved in multi-copper enzyme maturation permease subunit